MESLELITYRNSSVKALAEQYGYTVSELKSRLEISFNKKNIFSYSASTNTLYTYKNKYSKWLDPDRFLAYINVCLKNNPSTKHHASLNRYFVENVNVKFAVFDSYNNQSLDIYTSQAQAAKECDRLNQQWIESSKSLKK